MKVGSMFAGIGGFDLGFERAGFEVAWCIEWDKNAQAVLRKRFPEATIYGDIREVDPAQLARVDVVCGGFPCQDLSVAGKRAGLAGERSGLFHDAMRLVRQLNPKLLVLENVPGLLSSNHGLDFATVLREVGEGWDCEEVAWRVLDSQYFGVAQRRRRVFVVASSRIGCSEEVLALAESCGGNPPSRRKAREGVAADAVACSDVGREWPAEVAPTLNCAYANKMGLEDQHALNGAGHVVPVWWDGGDCAATLTKQNANGSQRMPDKGNFGAVLQPFSPHGHYRYEASDQRATLQDRENRQGGHTHLVAHAFYSTDGSHGVNQTSELCPPLKIGSSLGIPSPPAVAFKTGNSAQSRSDGLAVEQSPTLGSNAGGNTVPAVSMGMVVRRLTPVECERLQGFPDDWTQIGSAEKPTADSHRYKQLGNAVTVNVAEWIARRAHKCLSSR